MDDSDGWGERVKKSVLAARLDNDDDKVAIPNPVLIDICAPGKYVTRYSFNKDI